MYNVCENGAGSGAGLVQRTDELFIIYVLLVAKVRLIRR